MGKWKNEALNNQTRAMLHHNWRQSTVNQSCIEQNQNWQTI